MGKGVPVEVVEFAKYLLGDVVEDDAGELGLDLLLNPPVRGEVSSICFVSRAFATSEDSNDPALPVEDDRPRVTPVRELAGHGRPVAQNSNFDGCVRDAVIVVIAGEGLETINTTDSGARGQPIFDDKQALVAIEIEMLRLANFTVLDDAEGWEKTVVGIGVIFAITELREHEVSIVRD